MVFVILVGGVQKTGKNRQYLPRRNSVRLELGRALRGATIGLIGWLVEGL